MLFWRPTLAGVFFIFTAPTLWASNYLFLDKPYLDLTEKIQTEADAQASHFLEKGSALETKYKQVAASLRAQISDVQRARLLKKLKPELVVQTKDQQFADNLNSFKDALNYMVQKSGKSPVALFPSYDEWQKVETQAVSQGLDQRLDAFQTRFGPDSEPVNFIEYFGGELLLPGTEAGPSAWEPIARLSPVQATSAGAAVSSAEAGMNYYFVNRPAPAPLRWVGITNHVGLAATLQYLNNPRIFHFQGRPAFGLTLHLDRKELGASWDPDSKTVRVNIGYAFQVVPLAF